MKKGRRAKRRIRKNNCGKTPSGGIMWAWDVEYQCGLHVQVEQTSVDGIESKVAEMQHTCCRERCRACKYIRITERNADKFKWEANDGRMDTNTGKLTRIEHQV